jgi:hypothetical protein
VLLASCAGDTRVQLAITAPPIAIDSYQLKIGDRLALAEPHVHLEVVVPDRMAGALQTIEIWGLAAGRQVAYGSASVTPVRHGDVAVSIALAEIACGTWCQLGAVACASDAGTDGTITCEQQLDGCLGWSGITACPASAPFCSSGACGATCTDECTANATTCDSAVGVRTCGQFDGDTCLDWSPVTACASGQSCANGACQSTQVCGDDGDACDDGNGCTDGDVCSGDLCGGEPVVCDDPPAPICVSPTTLRTSSAGGTCGGSACTYAYTDTTCATGCAGGACIRHELDLGFGYSCALRGNGSLACWGDIPTPPTGTFTAVSAGGLDACGLRTDQTLACWNGDPTPAGTFRAVSRGLIHGCAIRSSGTVHCWGSNTDGESSPPTGTFTAISADYALSCGIRTDGTLACWGDAVAGVLNVPAGTFIAVGAGHERACGLRTNGALVCWGSAWSSPPPSGTFASLDVSGDWGCALRTNGEVACWGAGAQTPPPGPFRAVATGLGHVCAIRSTGGAVCWGGSNTFGELTPPEL